MHIRNHDRNAMFRWGRWLLVLALAALALAAVGGQPANAAPVDHLGRDQLRSDCELAGGRFFEKAEGGYSCWLGGLLIDCDSGGGCQSWCYEAHDCRCDLLRDVICVHAFTPDEPSAPWDDVVQIDPHQEAKLPYTTEPDTLPTGPVIKPDRVTAGVDAATGRETPATALEDGAVVEPARAR